MTALPQRQHLMTLIAEAVAAGARLEPACRVIGLSVRTLQRWRRSSAEGDRRPVRVQAPKNQLTVAERTRILAVLNSPEFGHLPPSQIVPRLADQGVYLASESTLYRLLRTAGQLAHRSAQRPGQSRHTPRAVAATAPRQLFSWDITYLPTDIKGQHVYLYLFLDVFSRKIVGWQVYERECSAQASHLLQDICARERIAPGQLILHADNGAPMKGATMLATLQALGVADSFSRPAVSNDNPYSEALFRTAKYRPDYPLTPFASLAAARAWAHGLVQWYNQEHRHSAIGFVTPAQRHAGLDKALLVQRRQVYEAAKARHPERWSGSVRNWSRVEVVHLNPEKPTHQPPTDELKLVA